jgi:hypothetical protein
MLVLTLLVAPWATAIKTIHKTLMLFTSIKIIQDTVMYIHNYFYYKLITIMSTSYRYIHVSVRKLLGDQFPVTHIIAWGNQHNYVITQSGRHQTPHWHKCHWPQTTQTSLALFMKIKLW